MSASADPSSAVSVAWPGPSGAPTGDLRPVVLVLPAHDEEASVAAVVARVRPGDVALTLGAGDVTLVGPEVLELLDQEPDPGEGGR